MSDKKEKLRREILDKVSEYYSEAFAGREYKPGDRINYGGRVFDDAEMKALVESTLDFWLTAGPYAERFEKEFAGYMGVKYCSLVNSGSSANLLAFYALTSPLLGERAIKRGDEVITVACGFPTTVAPVLQFGAVPVFVDVKLPYYNADVEQVERAVTGKTKAIMLAHTLGNPFNLREIKRICDEHNLWLIEDNCDSLGSMYEMEDGWRRTGSIGHIGTSSFYPPHHMTMGEGGAVYTNDARLHRIVNSFRDWGRDCWCPSGKDDTCGHRFDKQYGELPLGYDHKYVYSHFGFNLKVTDMQAAIGCEQLKKLDGFTQKRKDNYKYLREALDKYKDYLILPDPEPHSDPSWFGFLITVKDDAPFGREQLVEHLEGSGIQTRMLFASNLIKHPCFDEIRGTDAYRVAGGLENTDRVLERTFWIGVYPGMTRPMLQAMVDAIAGFVDNFEKDS